MRIIEVGKVFDENLPQFSGAQLGLFGDGLSLIISLQNCHEEIVKDVNKGEFELALTIKDGLMFFLFRLNSIGWADAPFTLKYYDNFDTENFDYNKIKVFLVDASNGILKSMCTICPNDEFQEELKKEFKRQNNEDGFNDYEYNQKMQEIYNKYSSEDLLKFSVVKSGVGSISMETMICN